MKPRFILPTLAAALATSGALLTLHAQEPAQPKQYRFEFRNDGSGLHRFENGKEVKPGGTGVDNADPFEDMRKEMEKEMQDLLRKHMGEGNQPGNPQPGNPPLDDLLKKLRERQGQQPKGQPNGGLDNLNELLRRAQSRTHGESAEASRYCKEHRSVLAEWRPLVKTAREATVRLMKDNKQIAFATVVSPDGYALTKASEVDKDGMEAEFQNGRIVSVKVVDKMEAYDLALIKLDATGLTAVKFSDSDAPVGTLVAAVGVDEDPLATGVISIAARSLSDKGKGALGIRFKLDGEDSEKGVPIGGVVPNCPADRAGLKEGDVIISVNGTEVEFSHQLQKLVASMKPGDNVKVHYSRSGKEADSEFALTSREELTRIQEEEFKKQTGATDIPERRQLDPTARMSGSLSTKAGGYPNAVQSDLVIDGQDCGGPVVDVDGNVVALSIARSERVSTYMIPGKVVQNLLANVHSGKFTLAKDADTLRGELREYETAVRKAQEAMKAAEESRAKAAEELQKLGK